MESYYNNFNNYLLNKHLLYYPESIKDKIKYILEDGKRLRPILYLIFAGIKEIEIEIEKNINIYNLASAIETIHCLSLVIDDLPEMDNDFLRRNKLSFHAKYGNEYTNFIVYYLFNKLPTMFDLFNDDIENITDTKLDIIKSIKYIIENNLSLLIDGQYCDIEWELFKDIKTFSRDFKEEKSIIIELLGYDSIDEKNNNLEELDYKISRLEKNIELNIKKTSSLFNMSIMLGFLSQLWKKNIDYFTEKCYVQTLKQLMIWANILGYMFQLSDDILDLPSDLINDKPNICKIINLDKAKELLINGCNLLNLELIDMQSNIEKQNASNERSNESCNESCNETNKFYINYNIIIEILEKIKKRIN
jgi:geranylgeranyl pyrophosphate synthase